LDCKNLYDFDRELYQQLINYPQEVIPIFDLVMNEAFQALVGVLAGEEAARNLTKRIEVRPFNLVETKTMRNLNPEGKPYFTEMLRYFCFHFIIHLIICSI